MKNQLLAIAAIFTASIGISPLAAHEHSDKSTGKELAIPIEEGSAYDTFHFSPAIRAGDFLYLSGVVANLPKDEEGKIVATTDEALTVAYEEAFGAIKQILEKAGSSWDDVVDMTTYHTDLAGQGAVIAIVKDQYVKAPYPAWTAIDIDSLFTEGGVTEIKVVAYTPR